MRKAKGLKSRSEHNIPDDLCLEILSRLPVKSLLRFRCVSRSWKAFIDDPDFARLHFNRFNNNRSDSQFLFVFGRRQCLLKNSETLRTTFSLGYLLSDLESPAVLRSTYSSEYSTVNSWYICSYCDGLFLLTGTSGLMLWNPSIRKTLLLPPLPRTQKHSLSVHFLNTDKVGFGLGFDPLIRDYKAVKFVLLTKEAVQFAAVYTLGTNSWKVIECRIEGRKDRAVNCWQSSISINGVLYGLGGAHQTFYMKLASFDLRTEVFSSFELPVTGSVDHYLSTIDDGRSLALICLSMSSMSVWALQGLGDDTKALTWIQSYTFLTVPPFFPSEHAFLCIKKNGEMLMEWKNKVECYNFETQERKILMEKNRKRFSAPNMFTYKESLIMHI